jgi:hypothetical protein
MTRTFSSNMRCCGLEGGAIRLLLPHRSVDVVDRLAVGSFSYGHSKPGRIAGVPAYSVADDASPDQIQSRVRFDR